ncbi:hypothetical protein AC15_3661 [Escherichia coli 2-156-04_S3_C2]|nr:hypothetical protein AC15_3661 [Escherichia coli 2-156-04_S3_C2]
MKVTDLDIVKDDLQRFTAKFCSLKIWIKLKIETLNNESCS